MNVIYECPKCHKTDQLSVQATLETPLYNTDEGPSLLKDGRIPDESEAVFDMYSRVTCEQCGDSGPSWRFVADSGSLTPAASAS